ncbi:MAG: hypothetical protein ACRCZF_28015, partial [Gemmataceae bacterium]
YVCVGWLQDEAKPPHRPIRKNIFKYEMRGGEFPVPVRDEWYRRLEKGTLADHPVAFTDILEWKKSPTPFPDEEFTLKHYGFPEPVNLPEPKTIDPIRPMVDDDIMAPPIVTPFRWKLWVAVGAGGIVLLVVAWLVRRRLRRQSPNKSIAP